MSHSSAVWRRRVVLAIATLCSASMVYYHLAIFVPGAQETRSAQGYGNGFSFGADFYPIWLTARERLHSYRDPYSSATTKQIQISLFGGPLDSRRPTAPSTYRAFSYPAFTDILCWPFALFTFSIARIALAIILLAGTILSIFLGLRFLRLNAASGDLILLIFYPLKLSRAGGSVRRTNGIARGFVLAPRSLN